MVIFMESSHLRLSCSAGSHSNPEAFPDGFDAGFGFFVDKHFIGPRAGKAFAGPFARGVNAHFGAEILHSSGVIQGVDRAQSELDIALWIDGTQRFPDDFAVVVHIHVVVHHHENLW